MSIEKSQLNGRFKEISNGRGGQGSTYDVTGAKVAGLPAVYKEYHASTLAQLDLAVIDGMIADAYELSQGEGGKGLSSMLALCAWPLETVTNRGRAVGILMPRIPNRFFVDFRGKRGVKRIEAKFELLLNDDAYIARTVGTITRQDKHQLLAALARGMKSLHRIGVCVGDLSPINLLWTLDPVPDVYFIDCDSMCWKGKSAIAPVETPGWDVCSANPGEVLGTPEADVYKFGLMVLRMLCGEQNTRAPEALPRGTAREVRELVRRSLDPSPSKRPTMSEWCAALDLASPRTYGLTPAAVDFCKTALKWVAGIAVALPLIMLLVNYWPVVLVLFIIGIFA